MIQKSEITNLSSLSKHPLVEPLRSHMRKVCYLPFQIIPVPIGLIMGSLKICISKCHSTRNARKCG